MAKEATRVIKVNSTAVGNLNNNNTTAVGNPNNNTCSNKGAILGIHNSVEALKTAETMTHELVAMVAAKDSSMAATSASAASKITGPNNTIIKTHGKTHGHNISPRTRAIRTDARTDLPLNPSPSWAVVGRHETCRCNPHHRIGRRNLRLCLQEGQTLRRLKAS